MVLVGVTRSSLQGLYSGVSGRCFYCSQGHKISYNNVHIHTVQVTLLYIQYKLYKYVHTVLNDHSRVNTYVRSTL